jgi:hypothetical protein
MKVKKYTKEEMRKKMRKPKESASPSLPVDKNADLLERCAEAVHKAYCAYYLKSKGVDYWTKGNYLLLDEPTKQIDRETVKAVFDVLKQS